MKQGPTLYKIILAETTHPSHGDEKNEASSDLIKTNYNLRHDEMNRELSLISRKVKLVPLSRASRKKKKLY